MAHSRKILLFQGESGSGKSTVAKQFVEDHPNFIRLNRDDLRLELANDPNAPKGGKFERFVALVEKSRADKALKDGFSVVLDNTHLNPNTVDSWRNFARHKAEFDIYRMTTPMEECILRDSKRVGKAHVGMAVIHRQFLMSGRLPIDLSKKIVICDIDGTIMDHRGIRSPFDESKVLLDKPFQKIIDEVNKYHDSGHTVIIISGRHSTCGDDTISSLKNNGVNFDFIFMRHMWSNEHDFIVKQQILDELLNVVPKELIIKILDDRPAVIKQCWLKNNLPIQPVYNGELIPIDEWTTDHSKQCKFVPFPKLGRCPDCGAIEEF
jgi:predicted kinase